MKNIFILLLSCVATTIAGAQKIIEKHLAFGQHTSVSVDIQIADSIRIITWNKSEVYVKASINVNDNKDNDYYEMNFDETGNAISVKSKLDMDRNKDKKKNWNCNYNTEIYCDVYVPENTSISVETINGNITISGKTSDIRAHSISGFIDLAFASERKADLKFNTISGTIYTNLAINTAPAHKSASTTIYEKYNGGGNRVDLETISGDIFFRKSE